MAYGYVTPYLRPTTGDNDNRAQIARQRDTRREQWPLLDDVSIRIAENS